MRLVTEISCLQESAKQPTFLAGGRNPLKSLMIASHKIAVSVQPAYSTCCLEIFVTCICLAAAAVLLQAVQLINQSDGIQRARDLAKHHCLMAAEMVSTGCSAWVLEVIKLTEKPSG